MACNRLSGMQRPSIATGQARWLSSPLAELPTPCMQARGWRHAYTCPIVLLRLRVTCVARTIGGVRCACGQISAKLRLVYTRSGGLQGICATGRDVSRMDSTRTGGYRDTSRDGATGDVRVSEHASEATSVISQQGYKLRVQVSVCVVGSLRRRRYVPPRI